MDPPKHAAPCQTRKRDLASSFEDAEEVLAPGLGGAVVGLAPTHTDKRRRLSRGIESTNANAKTSSQSSAGGEVSRPMGSLLNAFAEQEEHVCLLSPNLDEEYALAFQAELDGDLNRGKESGTSTSQGSFSGLAADADADADAGAEVEDVAGVAAIATSSQSSLQTTDADTRSSFEKRLKEDLTWLVDFAYDETFRSGLRKFVKEEPMSCCIPRLQVSKLGEREETRPLLVLNTNRLTVLEKALEYKDTLGDPTYPSDMTIILSGAQGLGKSSMSRLIAALATMNAWPLLHIPKFGELTADGVINLRDHGLDKLHRFGARKVLSLAAISESIYPLLIESLRRVPTLLALPDAVRNDPTVPQVLEFLNKLDDHVKVEGKSLELLNDADRARNSKLMEEAVNGIRDVLALSVAWEWYTLLQSSINRSSGAFVVVDEHNHLFDKQGVLAEEAPFSNFNQPNAKISDKTVMTVSGSAHSPYLDQLQDGADFRWSVEIVPFDEQSTRVMLAQTLGRNPDAELLKDTMHICTGLPRSIYELCTHLMSAEGGDRYQQIRKFVDARMQRVKQSIAERYDELFDKAAEAKGGQQWKQEEFVEKLIVLHRSQISGPRGVAYSTVDSAQLVDRGLVTLYVDLNNTAMFSQAADVPTSLAIQEFLRPHVLSEPPLDPNSLNPSQSGNKFEDRAIDHIRYKSTDAYLFTEALNTKDLSALHATVPLRDVVGPYNFIGFGDHMNMPRHLHEGKLVLFRPLWYKYPGFDLYGVVYRTDGQGCTLYGFQMKRHIAEDPSETLEKMRQGLEDPIAPRVNGKRTNPQKYDTTYLDRVTDSNLSAVALISNAVTGNDTHNYEVKEGVNGLKKISVTARKDSTTVFINEFVPVLCTAASLQSTVQACQKAGNKAYGNLLMMPFESFRSMLAREAIPTKETTRTPELVNAHPVAGEEVV